MSRNIKLDNCKAILIFLVVFGHSLEFIYGTNGVYGALRAIIYSFHMPAFVFLSGYFSTISKHKKSYSVIMYLTTFFLFNTTYALTPWSIEQPLNIFFPQLIYWYLLCLCMWKICASVLLEIKHVIPISIIIALCIGYSQQADRYLALSRFFCFLPFYLIGCKYGISHKYNKVLVLPMLIICSLITYLANVKHLIPLKMYEHIQSYHSCGISNAYGALIRFVIFIISFIVVYCIICISPSKECHVTTWGRNSLVIYVLHIYPIKMLSSFLPIWFEHQAFNIIFCVALSAIICIMFSFQPLSEYYKRITQKVADFFIL